MITRVHPLPMTSILTNLFDGVAYGMLLFVLACGLAVTLGLMNFVNLAHGAFAMAGGYVCMVLVNRMGWPFFAALPLAFVSAAAIGIVLERTLYRHLYARSHLDQVLFTIGLTFMSVAAVDYIQGSSRVFINLPAALQGQFDVFGVGIGRYRLMIIVICGLLTIGLQMVLAKTRFGSRLRAAVDDPRAASGLGIKRAEVRAEAGESLGQGGAVVAGGGGVDAVLDRADDAAVAGPGRCRAGGRLACGQRLVAVGVDRVEGDGLLVEEPGVGAVVDRR